ncbi:uncharacterized protein LOC18049487 [Citrus clementina]|uniref:uncharacterized protein LOC18049487 n=1 Tax=Citrus clementina TaxID=85681 RepID=UPI000CED4F58|nr:uncharacterized protein LOC18049487 [Citrus x clementina]
MSTSTYIRHTRPLASLACATRSKAFSFQLRVSTHSPLHSSHCKSTAAVLRQCPRTTLEQISRLTSWSRFSLTMSPIFTKSSPRWSHFHFWLRFTPLRATSTFPNLINFRVAKRHGFRRVFAHVAPIFFERGIAKPEAKEISSLSVEPCEGEALIVTVFEIQKSESQIPAFIKREHDFRFLAVLCARSSDRSFSKLDAKDFELHQICFMIGIKALCLSISNNIYEHC